jgi:hypothetical protein
MTRVRPFAVGPSELRGGLALVALLVALER